MRSARSVTELTKMKSGMKTMKTCSKCSRWGNLPHPRSTTSWKLCDIPYPAGKQPVRGPAEVGDNGKVTFPIIGYQDKPEAVMFSHADYTCDRFIKLVVAGRSRNSALDFQVVPLAERPSNSAADFRAAADQDGANHSADPPCQGQILETSQDDESCPF